MCDSKMRSPGGPKIVKRGGSYEFPGLEDLICGQWIHGILALGYDPQACSHTTPEKCGERSVARPSPA